MPEVCYGDMCVVLKRERNWEIPKYGHISHKPCIDSWLENQSTMFPICRVKQFEITEIITSCDVLAILSFKEIFNHTNKTKVD